MKITARYLGQMRFESGENAGRVLLDGAAADGGLGEALTPKQVVLAGLAGCTGLDVVYMLGRQKIELAEFSIDVEAEQTNAHPKVFKQIAITYRGRAAEDQRPAIVRAIEQSQEKFCGVSAMLGKTAKISWKLELLPPA